jgi:hypothetical protein
MKRIIPIVLVTLAVSTGMFAQGRGGAPPSPPAPLEAGAPQADVDKALLALPEGLRNQTTVIKWKSDFTYDTLRKGTNGLVCYDRSGMPLQQPFAVQCTSVANLPRKAQKLKAESTGDRAKSEAMLKEMEQNGTRAKPRVRHRLVSHVRRRSRSRVRARSDDCRPRRDAGVAWPA